MRRKEQLTIEECSRGYWAACAHYQNVKEDAYANYFQLRDAAAAASRWRNEWIAACERSVSRQELKNTRLAKAIARVCAETGEDPNWVSRLRSKAR